MFKKATNNLLGTQKQEHGYCHMVSAAFMTGSFKTTTEPYSLWMREGGPHMSRRGGPDVLVGAMLGMTNFRKLSLGMEVWNFKTSQFLYFYLHKHRSR